MTQYSRVTYNENQFKEQIGLVKHNRPMLMVNVKTNNQMDNE